MIGNGTLGGAGNEHQARGAGLQRLFGGVLDQRLVHDGQHLLGARLGGGQKAGAATGHREDCSANLELAHALASGLIPSIIRGGV